MRVKGMREVVTRRDLIDRAALATRSGMVTQLARAQLMVTQLARAQLEVIRSESVRDIWTANQREAERQVQRAAARAESLRRALDAGSPSRRKGARRARPGPVPVRQREVRLEY